MRHKNAFRKLSRSTSHRKALFRSLATNLVLHDRIVTTLPKAKELKRVADKLVTLGKTDTLHNRRQAMGYLFAINRTQGSNAHKLTAVHRLFTEIAPRYKEREGGYTRVVKLGTKRAGDRAPMAVIEFVEKELKAKKGKPGRRTRKKSEAPASHTGPAGGDRPDRDTGPAGGDRPNRDTGSAGGDRPNRATPTVPDQT